MNRSSTYLLFLLLVAGLFGMHCSARADDISGSGWRLWPDTRAKWQSDTLYMPSEVDLAKLPVNPPTGGWAALNGNKGIPVTLPSTVEEHYWGKFGLRPYTVQTASNYPDKWQMNGNYQGVSWWWRTISAPPLQPGQHLIVHIRGARLRSEVYCNGKLCGYSIMTELPYDADITPAVKPGRPALLAIRITNPGGIMNWNDFFPEHEFTWGSYVFPASHGFGGLDSGITLSVRDNVSVTDLATINKPDLHTIHLVATVKSLSQPYSGPVKLQISHNGSVLWGDSVPVSLRPGESKTVELDAHVPSAKPWNMDHPVLYQATARLGNDAVSASGRTTNFGFRFFTAVGVEKIPDPYLTLNGKRIVVRSAISWGFWGRNGLWPDSEMARREVSDAKAFGLNCLQFHRNIGKPILFDLQDRMGLLRYEEPGGGASAMGDRYDVVRGPTYSYDPKTYDYPNKVDTSGMGLDAKPIRFWEKYEEEKILEMVRRDRSHPSLIIYTIQNENSGLNMHNPRIYRLFREMHALDPSRPIVFFSGIPSQVGQALMLPYSDKITYSSKSDYWGGWHDQHTVGGAGNYTEELYTDPSNYSQMAPLSGINDSHKAINMFGEMLGVGSPDNFAKLVASFDAKHRTGYDHADDKRNLAVAHAFLDKWGFRGAFPTDSSYYTAIGNKSYFFWQKAFEQARADNYNDYLVISGWESTPIDNHSGLVDNHRFFKGDPALLRRGNLPEMLVVRPRHFVLSQGQPDLIDVFIVNETNRSGPYTLHVTVKRPDGTVVAAHSRDVTVAGGNTYGQLLDEAIPFTADTAGMMRVEASLTPSRAGSAKPLTRAEQVNVIQVAPDVNHAPRVAVLESGDTVSNTLTNVLHVASDRYHAADSAERQPDVIVFASGSHDPDFDTIMGSSGALDSALALVRDRGARLVLWPNGQQSAHWMMQQLADRHVVTLDNFMGPTGASWFGTWYFVRKHWLFNGLPTDCVMDWRYDNSWQPVHGDNNLSGTGGAVMSAPGLEVVCGYGSNEDKSDVGVSACVIPYGKGQIVWYCLPQMLDALTRTELATNSSVAQRLLANAVETPLPSR